MPSTSGFVGLPNQMNISRRQLLLILFLAAALVVGDFCIEILAPDVADWLKKEVGEKGYQNRLWVLLFIAVIGGLLIGEWQNWFKKEKAIAPSTSFDPSLYNELITNLKAKYQKRIDSKLAGRFPVNLRINASTKGTSDETAQSFITLQDEVVGHEIGEIFDRAKGRLLVIGLPGAGKTTLLLQLAVELLKRATGSTAFTPSGRAPFTAQHESNTIRDVNAPFPDGLKAVLPIPVLLNLATWRSEFATFDEWLKRILPNELGASKALAEKIRAQTPLILLLDGLDEVPEQDRNSCLEALGQYGIKPEHQFALTSRIQEYAAAKDAAVYGQVEVAPLTAQQIEMSLTAYAGLTPEAKPLLNAIQKDPLLKQSLENPFYLNTAQLLFASGKNWSEFNFSATDVEGRQGELVKQFVEYALTHKAKRGYSAKKSEKWLRFLAGKMEEDKLKVFELVDVNERWISKNYFWLEFIWDIIEGALYFLFSLIFWVVLVCISVGVFISYFYVQNSVAPTLEDVPIIFDTLLWAINYTIRFGIILGGIWWLFHSVIDIALRKGIPVRLMAHWGPWMFIIFFSSLLAWNEMKFVGVLAVLIFLLSFWAVFSIHVRSYQSFYSFLVLDRPYRRFWAALKWINLFLFEHLVLRFFLFIQSSLPLRLAHFLNEMSRRHLLEFDGDLDTETGGGSWRWRHRIIQEWFLKAEKD